jgi:hypothetical protein
VAGEASIHHSIHHVRVQTPSRLVALPWESSQRFLARCIAADAAVHPLVEQFRAVGISRPVDLSDHGDRDFALAVIDAWTADIGTAELPQGISELADALREEAIRDELFRLRARSEDVGVVDGISVQDRGHGNVVLTGSSKRHDFNYFRPATEILGRLRGLPADGGPEAIRSEFGRGH